VSELQLTDEQELVVFVILTVPSGDPQQMTANLRGPVVVNSRTKEAKQLILRDEHPTRYPIFGQVAVSAIAGSQAVTTAECRR
jgi:flagellar assembly factor FliW